MNCSLVEPVVIRLKHKHFFSNSASVPSKSQMPKTVTVKSEKRERRKLSVYKSVCQMKLFLHQKKKKNSQLALARGIFTHSSSTKIDKQPSKHKTPGSFSDLALCLSLVRSPAQRSRHCTANFKFMQEFVGQ